MILCYIIPKEIVDSTRLPYADAESMWKIRPWLDVGPQLIPKGPHAGSYCVNARIYESDPAFEEVRSLLEQFPLVEISPLDINI